MILGAGLEPYLDIQGMDAAVGGQLYGVVDAPCDGVGDSIKTIDYGQHLGLQCVGSLNALCTAATIKPSTLTLPATAGLTLLLLQTIPSNLYAKLLPLQCCMLCRVIPQVAGH